MIDNFGNQRKPASPFLLHSSPAPAPAPAADPSQAADAPQAAERWSYDDLVHISEKSADPSQLLRWTGEPAAGAPGDEHEVARMCCGKPGQEACGLCSPDNCKIIVKPLAPGPKYISISRDVKLGEDELVFTGAQARRIPILDADLQRRSTQLQRWHDHAFRADQEVHYHVYQIAAGSLRDATNNIIELKGKVIAIPVDPVSPQPNGPPR